MKKKEQFLLRQTIKNFKLKLKKDHTNGNHDPTLLINRIHLHSNQKETGEDFKMNMDANISMQLWLRQVSTIITQTYCGTAISLHLMNEILMVTLSNWNRVYRTQSFWMGNIVMGPENQTVDYMQLRVSQLQKMIKQTHSA